MESLGPLRVRSPRTVLAAQPTLPQPPWTPQAHLSHVHITGLSSLDPSIQQARNKHGKRMSGSPNTVACLCLPLPFRLSSRKESCPFSRAPPPRPAGLASPWPARRVGGADGSGVSPKQVQAQTKFKGSFSHPRDGASLFHEPWTKFLGLGAGSKGGEPRLLRLMAEN